MKDIPRFVADTHALVGYLTGNPVLGASGRAAFDAAECGEAIMVVPVIVLAELAWLVEHNKIMVDVRKLITDVVEHPGYVVAPLDEARLAGFLETKSVPEMHDRFIAVEANIQEATLVSRDGAIRDSGAVRTTW